MCYGVSHRKATLIYLPGSYLTTKTQGREILLLQFNHVWIFATFIFRWPLRPDQLSSTSRTLSRLLAGSTPKLLEASARAKLRMETALFSKHLSRRYPGARCLNAF